MIEFVPISSVNYKNKFFNFFFLTSRSGENNHDYLVFSLVFLIFYSKWATRYIL